MSGNSNLKTRTISALVGAVIMITAILVGRELLLGLMLAAGIIAYYELTRALGVHEADKKLNCLELIGIASSVVWYLFIEFYHEKIFTMLGLGFLLILIYMLLIMAMYVFTFPRFESGQVMSAIVALIYGPIEMSFIYLIWSLNQGIYMVWLVFVCSWICDIGAYLIGIKFGKHHFVPQLSPKKTVEGCLGGIAFSLIIGGLYAYFVVAPNISSASTMKVIMIIEIIALLGSMFSMVGDLAASAIKRNRNIKDYGKIMPGHGGIMDRFDSLFFVAPIIYILLITAMQWGIL